MTNLSRSNTDHVIPYNEQRIYSIVFPYNSFLFSATPQRNNKEGQLTHTVIRIYII